MFTLCHLSRPFRKGGVKRPGESVPELICPLISLYIIFVWKNFPPCQVEAVTLLSYILYILGRKMSLFDRPESIFLSMFMEGYLHRLIPGEDPTVACFNSNVG